MTTSFGTEFWPALLANLLSAAAVAALAYFLIERRLHLREREQRREDELERERARQWEVSQDVLRAVAEELDHNAQQAALLAEHLPRGEVPYPAFDVNGWYLLVHPTVVEAMQQRTLRRLVRVYNRFRTANDYHAIVNDVHFGPSGVMAVATITSIPDKTTRREEEEKFEAHRQTMVALLLERVDELRPLLDETRKLVHEELRLPPTS